MSTQLTNDAVERIAGLIENLVDLSGRYTRVLNDDDYLIGLANSLDCSFKEIVSKFNRNFTLHNEDIFTLIRFIQSADLDIQHCVDLLRKLIVPVEEVDFLINEEYAKRLSAHLNVSTITSIKERLASVLTPHVEKGVIDKLTFSGALAC